MVHWIMIPSTEIRAVFENVGRSFKGRPVFAGLDLELKRGGRYALLGPNGAGKTTLMRLLYGVLRPDQGRVLVEGREPWRETGAVLANMGVLAENAPLLPELTPLEHLKLAAGLRGLAPGEFSSQCERLSAKLNLFAFLKRPAGALSIGQKRRAALAAAFMGEPDFIILDEPSAGLDPEEALRLSELLAELPPSATLLLSSHILSEAYSLTDEAIILAQGRLAARGRWPDLLATTANPDEKTLRSLYLTLTQGAPK